MNSSRKAFEKWASKQKNEYGLPYFVILSDNGRYIDGTTNNAWDGWQAALQHSGEPVALERGEALQAPQGGEPQWIMIKKSSGISDWLMFDNAAVKGGE
jgi:hypothetical protein